MNSAASRLGCVRPKRRVAASRCQASRGHNPLPRKPCAAQAVATQAVAASRGRKPWPQAVAAPKHTFATQAYLCSPSIRLQPKHTYATQAHLCKPSRRMQSKQAYATQACVCNPSRVLLLLVQSRRVRRGSGLCNAGLRCVCNAMRCGQGRAYRFNRSIGSFTSCTRKYLASAGYFLATVSYIAYATLR